MFFLKYIQKQLFQFFNRVEKEELSRYWHFNLITKIVCVMTVFKGEEGNQVVNSLFSLIFSNTVKNWMPSLMLTSLSGRKCAIEKLQLC